MLGNANVPWIILHEGDGRPHDFRAGRGGLVFACEISGQNKDGVNEYKGKNEINKYKKKRNTDLLQRKNNLKRFLPIPRRH